MNETFKEQLTALSLDMQRICEEQGSCYSCKYRNAESMCLLRVGSKYFDPDKAIAAVEAYRKRKKPCAEVIDSALDVYTLEVEIERDRSCCANRSVDKCAEHLKQGIWQHYGNNDVAVRVLSAKRFALESHKEDAE